MVLFKACKFIHFLNFNLGVLFIHEVYSCDNFMICVFRPPLQLYLFSNWTFRIPILTYIYRNRTLRNFKICGTNFADLQLLNNDGFH